MNWNWKAEREGLDRAGLEIFEPLFRIAEAIWLVADEFAGDLTGARSLRPKSWRREFALWLIVAAVVDLFVLRPL